MSLLSRPNIALHTIIHGMEEKIKGLYTNAPKTLTLRVPPLNAGT